MMAPPKAGRYELAEEIGRGAMGVVYRAHDPVIGRSVAVKTMWLSEAGTGLPRAELAARFHTEARAAGLLAHANIVVVYDAGEEDGLFYITMEYIEGRSLQALIDAGQSFPLPRVLRLMEQACSALEYAHQRNIVHRDIKPANIMLAPDDTVKITDFGTAKILQFGTAQTAHVIGTPSYMSPEQVKGKSVDGRSDLFSLGVILYELVTGEKPFPGENITTVIYKILNEDPVPPRELDSSIHPGLSYVITRALAKEPTGRYPHAQELMEALRRYRECDTATLAMPARGASTAPGSTRPSSAAVRQAAAGVLRAAQPQAQKKSRHIWLALFLLAIIAGAGYRLRPSMHDVWERSRSGPAAPSELDATQPQSAVSPAPEPSQTSAGGRSAATAQGAQTARINSAPTRRGVTRPEPAERHRAENSSVTGATPAETPPAENASEGSGDTPAVPSEKASGVPASPETPAAPSPTKPPAQRKAGEAPRAELGALALKARLERRLAQVGLADKVQVNVTRNTVTLSGRLTPAEHRVLLYHLRNAPSWLHFVDNIEYVSPSPGEVLPGNRRNVPGIREFPK